MATIFWLPLLFDNKEIFDKKYGFVNVFIEDVNAPWLANSLYVLYRSNVIPKEITEKLRSNANYYDEQYRVIDGEIYEEYIFVIPKPHKPITESRFSVIDYDYQYSNYYESFTFDEKIKILKFWQTFDFPYIRNIIHERSVDILETTPNIPETVPEVDPIEDFNAQNSEIFFKQLGL